MQAAARVYAVTFQAISISASVDLFEIQPADDKPVRLLGIFVAQSSDFGEAQEEILRWSVKRGHTSSGSGGGTPGTAPVARSDTAAGFTAERTNTTVASGGTAAILHADAFNVRAGLAHFWTPETAPGAAQGDTTIVVRLDSTPVDAITCDGTLYVAELE